MSGQPVKTQSQKNKKRNEYMETLALQEHINDMNLQANKTYLLSGQLPPQSQMQDTRTTAEKLKDVEGMKQKIAGDFAGIIDTSSVYSLINMIISSPLNLNNSLFKFFAQRASSLAEQYRKQYSVGIEGDVNDVLRIYEYIKNMYSDTQGKFQSTKSYMNSQSSGSSSKVIGANDLESVILQLDDVIKNIQFTLKRGLDIGFTDEIDILLDLKETIFDLKKTIPDNYQMQILMQEFNDPSANFDPYKLSTYEEYFSLLEKLPKYNEVFALINKINQYISSNNLKVSKDGINKLKNMFAILFLPQTKQIINNFYSQYKNPLNITQTQQQNSIIQQNNMIQQQQQVQQKKAQKAQDVNIVGFPQDAVYTMPSVMSSLYKGAQGFMDYQLNYPNRFNTDEDDDEDNDDFGDTYEGPETRTRAPSLQIPLPEPEPPRSRAPSLQMPLPEPEPPRSRAPSLQMPLPEPPRSRAPSLQMPELEQITPRSSRAPSLQMPEPELDIITNIENQIESIYNQFPDNPRVFRNRTRDLINEQTNNTLETLILTLKGYPNIENIIPAFISDIDGLDKRQKASLLALAYQAKFDNERQSRGSGLKRRRVGRPRGTGMPKPERIIVPNFVGFGINEINQKQLKNGIVKIRRNTKTSYNDMPSKRVSSNLQGILKTISGGGIPNYNDLGKLDEDEKNYLNKLISRSNLTDRVSVPAPSKDQQEKDIHNFEVMRGQLMSGNDSQEMVKKFKLLIRKLAKQGLLPKNDVDELNDTLTDLGY